MLLVTAFLCAGYWIRAGLTGEEIRFKAAAPAYMTVVTGTVAELARVLGAPRPTLGGAALGSTDRFRAIGVIASASGQGAALISIDKGPPRPFRVGASIAPGFLLKEVSPREAKLADSLQGAVTATLPLPDPGKMKFEALNNNSQAPLPAQPDPLPNTAEVDAGRILQPTMRGAPSVR